MIQVLFEWQDEHLHGFNIPSDSISIDDVEETWGRQYAETKTRIDSFFRNYKWIRYTYDFGADWRHKINIEKIDEEYTERYATLLKFKGDNFIEDICWDMVDGTCYVASVEAIINGDPIDQVTEELTKENRQLWTLSVSTSIWRIVSGLMLDLELPMLKGRCRKRYAEEQKISPWSVELVEESEDVKNTKERRMSQFPEKIQEYMHVADNSGSGKRYKKCCGKNK